MEITLKLYAGLTGYLPSHAEDNAIKIPIEPEDNAFSILNRFQVPNEKVHLVLLNGIYLAPEERSDCAFKEGDTLAVWPPVAGG